METHPDFGRGQITDNTRRTVLWSKLNKRLNIAQGAVKNEFQWKKFYNDWKFQIRKKYARAIEVAKRNKAPTPRRVECLTTIENRLMKLLARRSTDDEIKDQVQNYRRARSSRKVKLKDAAIVRPDTPEEDPLEDVLVNNVPTSLNTSNSFIDNNGIIQEVIPGNHSDESNNYEDITNINGEHRSNDNMLYQINQSILKLNKTMEVIAGHLATIAKK